MIVSEFGTHPAHFHAVVPIVECGRMSGLPAANLAAR
jgi:hypothetical protein